MENNKDVENCRENQENSILDHQKSSIENISLFDSNFLNVNGNQNAEQVNYNAINNFVEENEIENKSIFDQICSNVNGK